MTTTTTEGVTPAKPDCDICGKSYAHHQRNGGGVGSCQIYPTYRARPTAPGIEVREMVRDAVENALLAADIAGETYGSKADRITNAVIERLAGIEGE